MQRFFTFIFLGVIWLAPAEMYSYVIRPVSADKVAAGYSAQEKVWLSSYLIASLLDAGQTLYGLRRGAVELNPLMGKSPSRTRIYAIKSLAATGTLFLLRSSRKRDRRWLLWIMNSIQWSAVAWNGLQPGIGLRLRF